MKSHWKSWFLSSTIWPWATSSGSLNINHKSLNGFQPWGICFFKEDITSLVTFIQFLPTSLNFLHLYVFIFMQLCFPKARVSCWALHLKGLSFFVPAKGPLFFLREAWLLSCSKLPSVCGAIMNRQSVFHLGLWWARSWPVFLPRAPALSSGQTCQPRIVDLSPGAEGSKTILSLASLIENCFTCCLVTLTYCQCLFNVVGPSSWILNKSLRTTLSLTTWWSLTLLLYSVGD